MILHPKPEDDFPQRLQVEQDSEKVWTLKNIITCTYQFELSVPTITFSTHPLRQNWNHSKTLSPTPFVSKLSRRVWWLTVLKVAERSKRIWMVMPLPSKVYHRSPMRVANVLFMSCPSLNPDSYRSRYRCHHVRIILGSYIKQGLCSLKLHIVNLHKARHWKKWKRQWKQRRLLSTMWNFEIQMHWNLLTNFLINITCCFPYLHI